LSHGSKKTRLVGGLWDFKRFEQQPSTKDPDQEDSRQSALPGSRIRPEV